MIIGQRIRERRLELDMTQEELAKAMNYKSKSTINKIELGINDIPLSKVVEFASALHTSVAYLMDWSDDPAPHTQEEIDSYDPLRNVDYAKARSIYPIIEAAIAMDDIQLERLLSYAKFIITEKK